MKIAYIAPQAIPSQAANSIHMMKMAQAMANAGHNVTLLAARGSNDKDFDIFFYYGVKQNFKLLLQHRRPGKMGLIAHGFKNATAAKQLNADIVFSRCLMSGWASAISGKKVLFEIHDSPRSLGGVAQSIFRRLKDHKNFIGLVVISDALKKHIAEYHNVSADKIIVAHDGADPLPPAKDAPFEKTPGSFHAGYTGHLYKGRGVEVIAAMANAANDITFHIVGGAPNDLAYWQSEYKTLKNIVFYGHVPPGHIPDYLQNFDVLLAPYQKKVAVAGNVGDTSAWMSPLKIFEYMSSGKPMICSDIPLLREVLNESNAILVPPDDTAGWTLALKKLQADKILASKIGAVAQKDFLEKYTWQKRAEFILASIKHAV
jgi:glycosyltransferase involved in cell wall biosynthesis